MKKLFARAIVFMAIAAFTGGALDAATLYATNGSTIARFNSASPSAVTTISISGMQIDETLVGLDRRPANGLIYGISSMNRLYLIDPTTAKATQVGADGGFTLNGTSFGMDFNPVPDRLRLVSNAEQNFRLNADTGATVATDGPLSPAGNIVAVAYTNNFAGATTTTLYAIDSVSGQLYTINPPNNGTLNPIGSLGLGTNLNENIGFDISGTNNTAYATVTFGGESRLFSIDLVTGAATSLGRIGNGMTPYPGVTVGPDVKKPNAVPTVKINGPKNRTSNTPNIRLRGTATDDSTVARVEYRLGKGKYLEAKGTLKWSIKLKLTKPVTRVSARSIDDANATSATDTVIIRRTR